MCTISKGQTNRCQDTLFTVKGQTSITCFRRQIGTLHKVNASNYQSIHYKKQLSDRRNILLFNAMANSTELSVVIDGENYQLVTIPHDSSALVKEATKKLLGSVSLDELVNDLGQVGKLVRIAYNAAGAAGPKFTHIQIEVYMLSQGLTRVCNKSALTISRFETAAVTVLETLQGTYGYLLDGLEELAVSTLADIATVAADMKAASQELRAEFDKQVNEVTSVHNKTMEAEGAAAIDAAEMKKQKEDEQRRREAVEKEVKETLLLEQEAEAARIRYEKLQLDTINEMCDDSFNTVVQALTFGIVDTNGTKTKLREYKNLRLEQLKKEEEYRQKKFDRIRVMTEMANNIETFSKQETMSDLAAKSLHDCIGYLKQLSEVMMRASLFWQQLEDHCKSLAENAVKNQVETTMKLSEEKRRKVWTSDTFKTKAIRFYGGWVALKCVCTQYMEPIKKTQQELFSYLRENPTYEECKTNLETLAKNFKKDLERDQKALEEKVDKAKQEKLMLEGGTTPKPLQVLG